jgi:hypothetical protein
VLLVGPTTLAYYAATLARAGRLADACVISTVAMTRGVHGTAWTFPPVKGCGGRYMTSSAYESPTRPNVATVLAYGLPAGMVSSTYLLIQVYLLNFGQLRVQRQAT